MPEERKQITLQVTKDWLLDVADEASNELSNIENEQFSASKQCRDYQIRTGSREIPEGIKQRQSILYEQYTDRYKFYLSLIEALQVFNPPAEGV